jgi:RNA polymerase sigma-70 factor (ECF subfamily)
MEAKQSSVKDDDLVLNFNKDNEKAFNQIYNKFYGSLCYFAEKLVLHREMAEEVVINAFIKTWKVKHKSFASLNHIKGYLFESTKNESLNYLICKDRYQGHLKSYAQLIERNIENYRNERVEVEMLELIFDASESLPPQCKKIFKMLYQQDLKFEEVAEVLNINHKTVRSQKDRAIQLIKQMMPEKLKSNDRQEPELTK